MRNKYVIYKKKEKKRATISKMKNRQDGISIKLHIVIEKISELGDSNRNYPNETQRKRLKKEDEAQMSHVTTLSCIIYM